MLSKTLKRYRKEKKMTQVELANKLGVTVNTVQNYENGRRKPSDDMLEKISDVLDIPTDILISKSVIDSFRMTPASFYETIESIINTIEVDSNSEDGKKIKELANRAKEESRKTKTNRILNEVDEILKEELPFNFSEEEKKEVRTFIKDCLEMKIKSIYDKKK